MQVRYAGRAETVNGPTAGHWETLKLGGYQRKKAMQKRGRRLVE